MINVPNALDKIYPTAHQQQTPVVFTGNTRDYFGIWIVNLLLTILTLGIYSAWAKVRTKKYFSNHTLIGGVGFDYHAKPLSILKGRLIAAGLYLAYAIVSKISPIVAVIFMIGLFICTPWVILQSVKFNLSNTSHRGLRFSFSGKLGEAVKIYLLMPLLTVFTLGLIWPYISFRSNKFRISHASYGRSNFICGLKPGAFYLLYLAVAGLVILVGAGLFTFFRLGQSMNYFGLGAPVFISVLFFLFYFTLLVPAGFMNAKIGNLVYGTTTLAQFSFHSAFRARDLIWIYASNIIAVVVSLGLLYPWTKVRLMRYYASHLAILGEPDFDHFAAGQANRVSAVNEGIADIFDIEVASVA